MMKPSLAIKTLFRTVGKTLFTFLLIAVLTFSLFIQLAEYQTTAEEFAKNVDMYHGIGFLEKEQATYNGFTMLEFPYYIETDPRVNAIDIPELDEYKYATLSNETVDTIRSLPYVSSSDRRYMTAGRSAFLRLMDHPRLWDYNGRAVLECTLDGSRSSLINSVNPAYQLSNCRVLAGDMKLEDFLLPDRTLHLTADYIEPGMNLYPVNVFADGWVPSASLEDGNHHFRPYVWGVTHVCLKNYAYGESAQRTWNAGNRFVFVVRFYRVSHPEQKSSLYLYDWLSEHFCPAVWDVTDAPENYLELSEYAPLKQLIEITESDLHTLDVVYVDDMRDIKQVHEGRITLTEGRWLTLEDTENQAKVCMLDETFARTYGLQVGDTLPLELGDELFEQFYNLGAVAGTVERYADNWTQEEFEVVGLYQGTETFAAAKEPNWSYSVNTVFVPLSSLPETADTANWELAPGEFTFRVDDAWDIAPFLEQTAPQIEAMGLTLMFDDGGWMEVYKPYVEAQRIAMIRIVLLAAVTVMATAFVEYLFISRKRKDYAIMRALGTPKNKSGASLLLPLMLLAVVSVLAGLAAAAVYIGHMSQLAQPPIGLALLCGLVELLLTLFLALGLLHTLSRQSPLALLQGGRQAGKAAKPASEQAAPVQATATIPMTGQPVDITQEKLLEPLRRGKPHALRFVLRYVLRHMRRSAVKSLLAILVAALMLAAVAQLGHMRGVYDQLQRDTVVTAKFNMSLSLPRLKELEADGLATDLYYERSLDTVLAVGVEHPALITAVTNNVARYVGADCTIDYAPGYGPEDMSVVGQYAVVGSDLLAEHGLTLGDTVRVSKQEGYEVFLMRQLSWMSNENPEAPLSYEALFMLYPEHMEEAMNEYCDCFTIIGSVTTGNSTYDSMVFTPGMETTKKFMADNLLEFAEFRIPDNSRAQEMKNLGEALTHNRSGAFSIDLEKLESVERTAALLETLYPIVIALALLIGAALCALLVMQTGKDAAIMRALGTTKRMTRSMVALEQIILGMLGVLLGLLVMLAWKRAAFAPIAVQAGLFAGAYALVLIFSSYISAAFATRKNILELLQTKE